MGIRAWVVAAAIPLVAGLSVGRTAAVPMPARSSLADAVTRMTPPVVNVSTRSLVRPGRAAHHGESSAEESSRDPFDEFFQRFFGGGPARPQLRRSLGSGVIIDPGGYILTNDHVIGDASDIKVTLGDERSFTARLVGRDPRTDVALLKIDAASHLPVAQLGDSDGTRVGDTVVAIGNPFGLNQTVTVGIVSAKGRVIGAGPYDDFIQTDASINPGNSGGPLYNLDGEVVGLATAIVESAHGIGFAIPANLIRSMLPQLRNRGRVTRGLLGVSVQHLTPELARAFHLPSAEGALVAETEPDGPAARAGVQRGDVISSINGRRVTSSDRLPEMVAVLAPGSRIELGVVRDGRSRRLEATVGELIDAEERKPVAGRSRPGARGRAGLGIGVRSATPTEARDLNGELGVVVDDIDPFGAAAGVIERGDVILEVNRRPTRDVAEFRGALVEAPRSSPLLLRIRRGEATTYLVVEPPA